jgi:GT2 family glycosyltransferase
VKFSVIIITHNRLAYCSALLDSVFNSTRLPDEVLVVDNGSSDGSSDELAKRFPTVRIIRNDDNLLVTKACNIGLAAAAGDALMLVADDNVLDPNCLKELEECLERHSDIGILGPIMHHFDDPDRVWFAGATTNLTTGFTRFYRKPIVCGEGIGATDSVPNCMVLTRRAYEVVKGFDDELFPMHHEEADLGLRLKEAGFRAAVALDALEYHRVPVHMRLPLGSGDYNVDNTKRAWLHGRARVLLTRIHGSALQKAIYLTVFMPLTALVYVVLTTFKGGIPLAAAFLSGTVAGLKAQTHHALAKKRFG